MQSMFVNLGISSIHNTLFNEFLLLFNQNSQFNSLILYLPHQAIDPRMDSMHGYPIEMSALHSLIFLFVYKVKEERERERERSRTQ